MLENKKAYTELLALGDGGVQNVCLLGYYLMQLLQFIICQSRLRLKKKKSTCNWAINNMLKGFSVGTAGEDKHQWKQHP